jgi:hypothetical protein
MRKSPRRETIQDEFEEKTQEWVSEEKEDSPKTRQQKASCMDDLLEWFRKTSFMRPTPTSTKLHGTIVVRRMTRLWVTRALATKSRECFLRQVHHRCIRKITSANDKRIGRKVTKCRWKDERIDDSFWVSISLLEWHALLLRIESERGINSGIGEEMKIKDQSRAEGCQKEMERELY